MKHSFYTLTLSFNGEQNSAAAWSCCCCCFLFLVWPAFRLTQRKVSHSHSKHLEMFETCWQALQAASRTALFFCFTPAELRLYYVSYLFCEAEYGCWHTHEVINGSCVVALPQRLLHGAEQRRLNVRYDPASSSSGTRPLMAHQICQRVKCFSPSCHKIYHQFFFFFFLLNVQM